MRLPVPAVLTSNHFLSLPARVRQIYKKKRRTKVRKKENASFSRFFCYSIRTMKANKTMLEVDDVSCYQQAGYEIGSSRD